VQDWVAAVGDGVSMVDSVVDSVGDVVVGVEGAAAAAPSQWHPLNTPTEHAPSLPWQLGSSHHGLVDGHTSVHAQPI